MRRFVLVGATLLIVGGCASSHPSVRHKEAPANVTFPLAMGNFQRVYNTAYTPGFLRLDATSVRQISRSVGSAPK